MIIFVINLVVSVNGLGLLSPYCPLTTVVSHLPTLIDIPDEGISVGRNVGIKFSLKCVGFVPHP